MTKDDAYIWDENNKLGYVDESKEDVPIAGEPRPQIEPGEYTAICQKTEVKTLRNWGRKIFIHFVIVGGKHDGTKLFMSCNYPRGIMSARRKYYRQWVLVNGKPPAKGKSLVRSIFPGKKYLVLVKNSKCKHSNDRIMADSLQYSIVDSIVKVIPDEK